jgi:hypothetical protein
MINTCKATHRNLIDLTPIEESLLMNIANSQTTVAYQAQAMLYQARGYEFPVIIPQLPNTGLEYGATVFKTDNSAELIQPFIPNPTTGMAQLVYNLTTDTRAVLTLANIHGKVLQQVSLIGNGVYDLDTHPLSWHIPIYHTTKWQCAIAPKISGD